MARPAIPTWFFAVVVVQRGDEFLLVHERKHEERWYLPAGRVEPGETFAAAAIRETAEETGLQVELRGVLRVEHSPRGSDARLRVIFLAHPTNDRPPKSVADEESLGAGWFTLEQARALPLRGPDVLAVLEAVASGLQAHALSVLDGEGMPWRAPSAPKSA